jgi:hypothetical protein
VDIVVGSETPTAPAADATNTDQATEVATPTEGVQHRSRRSWRYASRPTLSRAGSAAAAGSPWSLTPGVCAGTLVRAFQPEALRTQ